MASTALFYVTYVFCLALGLLCVVCVTYWSSRWRGGFAWDASALQFNWHPVLMVTGLLVLFGYAAIMYRVPFTWQHKKHTWKLVHSGLLLSALLLSTLGLCAVFDFHSGYHIPDLYSLHSWVGICTTFLFALQWALGLGVFMMPCSPLGLRKLLKPVHVWMGGAIFILSVISCISGINEKLLLTLNRSTAEAYSSLPVEAVFANILGILIVAFGFIVLRILTNQKWKRPEQMQEESQLLPGDS
ncbi:lysosomal membrane ascorbate-dependent ferrireductase CYB561A3-like [Hypomesus transpacificus]|uniref:lysosomal membrane ascorbate-dependent ferrireductase CYB561A3-like n=1 Tax=Hypomesus transpacificus TaxID=137520 RepID=UPI001F078D4F|nr:lysosomal membrane ascorbate-dependent ferrireductase CYB561A3-like [Hypomesus transpacificus]